MKIFFKKNKVLLTVLILIIIWVIITCFMYLNDFNIIKNASIKAIENCKMVPNIMCPSFKVAMIPDTISIFFQLMLDYPLKVFIFYLYPLFIIMSTICAIYNELKKGYIKNALTRMPYKKYISKTYLSSLKNILILPIFLLILFIASYILSGGNIIIPSEETAIISQEYLNNIATFAIIYIFNLLLISLFVVNISFIATVKCEHIITAIVGSYIGFWLIWIFSEAIIGLGLQNFFSIENVTNSLSLGNFWAYDNVIGLPFEICYAVILAVISGVGVYLSARNKERVVLNGEKTI